MPSFVNYSHYREPEDFRRLVFFQETLLKRFPDAKARVLDLGCGNGNVSLQLAGVGFQVVGVDLSAETIAIAQARNVFPDNLEFRVLPAEEIENLEPFDAVICSEVLEHLYDPHAVMRTIYKLVKPEGVVCISVPNGWGPREVLVTRPMQFLMKGPLSGLVNGIKRMLGYKGVTGQSASGDLTHVQFYTKGAIVSMAQKAGFKLQSFGKVAFIAKVFPFSLIFRNHLRLQWYDCVVATKLPHFLASGFTASFTK